MSKSIKNRKLNESVSLKSCCYCKNHLTRGTPIPLQGHQQCKYNNIEHLKSCEICRHNPYPDNFKRCGFCKNHQDKGDPPVLFAGHRPCPFNDPEHFAECKDCQFTHYNTERMQDYRRKKAKSNPNNTECIDEYEASNNELSWSTTTRKITMFILSTEYPCKKICEADVSSIIQELYATPHPLSLNCDQPTFQSGLLKTECYDVESRDWLIKAASKLSFKLDYFKGFKALPKYKVPMEINLWCIVKQSIDETEFLCSIGPKEIFDSSKWKVSEIKQHNGSTELYFSIDPLSLCALLNEKFNLYVKDEKVKVEVIKNPYAPVKHECYGEQALISTEQNIEEYIIKECIIEEYAYDEDDDVGMTLNDDTYEMNTSSMGVTDIQTKEIMDDDSDKFDVRLSILSRVSSIERAFSEEYSVKNKDVEVKTDEIQSSDANLNEMHQTQNIEQEELNDQPQSNKSTENANNDAVDKEPKSDSIQYQLKINSLECAVVTSNYPETSFDQKAADEFHQKLRKKLYAQPDDVPRITSNRFAVGAKIFQCDDQHSVDWLKENVRDIKLTIGGVEMALKVISLQDIKRHKVKTIICKQDVSNKMKDEIILERFKIQNPQLQTSCWIITNRMDTKNDKLELNIKIDEKSYEKVMKEKIYFDFESVTFQDA